MKPVPPDKLAAIERHFHDVIRGRAAELVAQHNVMLPKIMPPLPTAETKAWLPIPGMYGGFSYWLEGDSDSIQLVTESWCRVSGGSGQRHVVKPGGSELVDEGFV